LIVAKSAKIDNKIRANFVSRFFALLDQASFMRTGTLRCRKPQPTECATEAHIQASEPAPQNYMGRLPGCKTK
jgi:hypothetical protein